VRLDDGDKLGAKGVRCCMMNLWSIAFALFCQTKKGVKRKADTTAPCLVTPASASVYSSSLESASTPLSAPPAVGRRDMLRPVKRPKKETLENDGPIHVGPSMSPVSDAWKLCTNIVRDLMSKKCQVSLRGKGSRCSCDSFLVKEAVIEIFKVW